MMKKFVFVLYLFFSAYLAAGQSANNKQKLEEWKDARFGMFIHWGPVSLKGTEIGWSRGREIPIAEYDNLYKRFDAPNFDANQWVTVAKAAGMKYIILTTKHHDGFCLWNTRQTDFNVMNSPLHRDVVKELAEACRQQGLAFGTYYSTTDWHHPDFPLTSPGGSIARPVYDLDAYTSYLKRQVAELLVNYGPLFVLWFDVPQRFDAIRGQSVIDFAHAIQPDIIVNNRTGARGDFDTPEQRVGNFQNERPWETCMTIASQWAWKPNDRVKSLEQCLHSLIRTAGGDGNLLFNVGPKSDGQIEPEQVARLREMGQWLKEYGFTVYGTRGGPYKPTDWGVTTRKGNFIYLHLLKWAGDQPRISLPDPGIAINKCRIVQGGKVKLTKVGSGYEITFSRKDLQPINTIIELELSEEVMKLKPIEMQPASLSYLKTVRASSNPIGHWSNFQWVDLPSVTNGDWSGSFWEPEENDTNPWIEIDLGQPQKVTKALLYERGNAVKKFELQCLQGQTWKSVYKGATIGLKTEISLPKVNAQKFRLLLKEFDALPGIYELMLM